MFNFAAPDIKKKVRIKMINAQGLDEAGIDGGGIFREFMSQLVKQGFDPSYGFFKSTSERLLYPNPRVSKNYNCLLHGMTKTILHQGQITFQTSHDFHDLFRIK